ncbi:hypothetical protein ACM26V_07600 [Salipaludibacillus sp. HK11]|uniref:hypothetical protein n=1 Tax=Salipaludibacillus sp. HK11 TaxID=3394320 RepID=UPI0039FC806A
MRNLDNIRIFHEELEKDKSLIFDYARVSRFERELFLSIAEYINDKYEYELKGLTKKHYRKLVNEIDSEHGNLELIKEAFKLNSMITKRTISMGYGGYAEKKIVKNYKLNLFLKTLKHYIHLYENLT